jgi:hypothetical protein
MNKPEQPSVETKKTAPIDELEAYCRVRDQRAASLALRLDTAARESRDEAYAEAEALRAENEELKSLLSRAHDELMAAHVREADLEARVRREALEGAWGRVQYNGFPYTKIRDLILGPDAEKETKP